MAHMSPWQDALKRNDPQAVRGMHRLFLRMRDIDNLRPHEQRVLQALADGRTEPEAAEHLNLSRSTVHTYARTARLRLGARNTTQAVAIAWRTGLIT